MTWSKIPTAEGNLIDDLDYAELRSNVDTLRDYLCTTHNYNYKSTHYGTYLTSHYTTYKGAHNSKYYSST